MIRDYKEQLENAGVDWDTTLNRFMNNEVLYAKFLSKFLEDQTFNTLKNKLENKNIKEAFIAAHSLKGICGNLGLSILTDIISPMADQLRLEQTDGIDEMMDNLKKNYLEICSIIKRMS